MGSTNKTAHYELPQFVANDKPSWLGDINQAMEDIDTGIYGAKSSADGAQQTANNAVAGVASAGTRMDGIQTQLDTVATQANQTATTVTQHTSNIATNSANINTINSRLGSTDISGIGDGTVTGAIDAIAQGGGGGSTAWSHLGDLTFGGGTLTIPATANEVLVLMSSDTSLDNDSPYWSAVFPAGLNGTFFAGQQNATTTGDVAFAVKVTSGTTIAYNRAKAGSSTDITGAIAKVYTR